MVARLPIELVDLVVQYSATDTRAHLSTVSRGVYSISIRVLYSSILDMSVSRTIRCLLTLSRKPELALLVRSFSFYLSPSPNFLRPFLILLSRVLGNLHNLRTLTLQLGVPITMNLLGQISSRLTRLIYIHPFNGPHPASQFLSNQTTIEELLLVCQPSDLSTLDSDALPALKELAAPLWLLPNILPSRLPRLSQLTLLGIMNHPLEWFLLGVIIKFSLSNPLQSLELIVRAKISEKSMTTMATSLGLALLGLVAPFISSLTLDTYGHLIKQNELQNMIGLVLPHYPNLKTLIVTSQPPTPGACMYEPPPQSAEVFSDILSSLHQQLLSMSDTLDNISNLFSAFLSRYSAPQAEPDQTQDQSTPLIDALHDGSCHLEIINAWRQIHPGLERVVFPVGAYLIRKNRNN
ncbi:unnamed protein product [Rhizoctonia solani]|uniref:F-box domain-containing protein n=1 Tax=Rhizoctonia solani TaxID=456999 RepID=A0A8H3B9I9_9AGAM|nr:unnamed protein product [Rhizoctonia solani]